MLHAIEEFRFGNKKRFPYKWAAGYQGPRKRETPGERDVELLNRREIEARRGVTAQIRKDSGGIPAGVLTVERNSFVFIVSVPIAVGWCASEARAQGLPAPPLHPVRSSGHFRLHHGNRTMRVSPCWTLPLSLDCMAARGSAPSHYPRARAG